MSVIPTATYRIQFSPTFDFEHAKAVTPYLASLGVSHIYASPIFKARPGSSHGYDVCDPQQINPELGGEGAFRKLAAAASKAGLGWVQDIVPNHMAVSGHNRMLVDLLENGEASRYHPFFDIDWSHPLHSIKGRMLAPFLGGPYGEILERGEIRLGFDEDGFHVAYWELRLPIRIDSYPGVLTYRLEQLADELGRDHPDVIKLLGALYTIRTLPTEPERADDRYHQIHFIKRILHELYIQSETVRDFLDANMARFNGEGDDSPEDPSARFDLLDQLLQQQHFRLSFWKVAGEEINYRRFFSINDLISLRAEDEAVFDHTHALILELVREGVFHGLRVDHVDGLYDPTAYLKRLREGAPEAYIVVEKILTGDEPLPGFWAVQGATGYEFMDFVTNLFVDQRNETEFDELYRSFTGRWRTVEDLAASNKRRITERHMGGDVENMAWLVNSVSSKDRHAFDITLAALKRAITELMIRFPVYRTYISNEAFRPADLVYIRAAIRDAVRAQPELAAEFDFLDRFLLLEFDDRIAEADRRQWIHFVMRFQQFTGPLMAKGMEDTTFYVFNRLLCLNEVGSELDRFGMSDVDFHERLAARAAAWPHGMNATATHDHKRGEDARMRLAALSETPEAWRAALKEFSRINARKKTELKGRGMAPFPNDEYFLYQTLLATWPLDWPADRDAYLERVGDYMVKALREGKETSNWIEPDDAYETAVRRFLESLLSARKQNAFLREFIPLAERLAQAGMVNSLAQLAIKLAAPGVPDFYQGVELWDFSMVDPDNRRPVDFEARSRALETMREAFAHDPQTLLSDLLAHPEDGRIKLFLTAQGLALRAEKPELFANGAYAPLTFAGKRAPLAFGFARRDADTESLVVVPRFVTAHLGRETRFPLAGFWEDTRVAGVHAELATPAAAASASGATSGATPSTTAGTAAAEGEPSLREAFTAPGPAWRNVLTGASHAGPQLPLRELLAEFPVALLVRETAAATL